MMSPPHSGAAMDDNSLFFALNRRLGIFTRCLSLRLIHGLAVLVLAGGSVSAWAQEEPADPVADFCDLVMVGGSSGASCAALAEAAESTARVSYEPEESPWRLGEGSTADSGQALFSAALGSGESSCLRLRLNEGRQLVETNLRYIVDAGDSTGTLTILLERGGEADAEEILRASGEVVWTSMKHTVDLGQSPVVGISICYEKGSGIDASLDRAGVDNIRLDTVDPVAEFCDLVVAGGSGGSNCVALAEDEGSGAKVSYVPMKSPWRGGDGNSGLALFSGAVSSGESSCLRLRPQLNEMRRLVTINFAYTVVSAGTSTGALTISIERDGEENELIFRRSSPESEWIEFEHAVNLDRARVSGLLACYQQGAMEGLPLDRAGLDDLSFVYEYVYDRDEFCDVAVQGGRSGENCEWIQAVQSDPVDELWGDSASFMQFGDKLEPSWVVANLGFRQMTCLRLLLQSRLDSSVLAGLSFNFRSFGFSDRYEFRIQRVGQENFESIRDMVQLDHNRIPVESYTSDLDLASGLISSFIVCYSVGRSRPSGDVVQFALNAIQFEDEVIAVSRLRSTLPPRLFHIAQRSQSVDFAVQALSQFGTVIDAAVQTTLTVRSGVAGMLLNLAVPETGQSASGEGEVSLPLIFSGEQNVVLGFDIPFAVADGTTLAVTVSAEEESIAGESHELALFDFCGLVVRGGRDDEGDADLQQSCSDFAQVVSALRFDPPDKPWRLGEGPTEDSGQALFSAELDSGESSCMRLRLSEDQQLFATRIRYTVDAGTSAGALTISLERDGEAGEDILRESGEVPWATLRHKAALGRSRVVGISICYEKGLDGGDAGLDWAGVDNIRLEPVDPVTNFCDLVVEGGSGGSSCAALAEAAESTAGVSYEPAENPWRLGDGPTDDSGLALFSAAVGSDESSCLRLQFRDGRQLVAVNFAYTVSAGTSSGVLTIALRRAGEADEEVLRQSGEQDWTEMLLPTAIPGRRPVEGVSICYEKGADGGDAGLDWAGVDNIRLEPVDPVTNFCDLVVEGGRGGSSCATLAEATESTARVSYVPARSPWRLGEGPTEDSGLALFSAELDSDESSCLRLQLREGRQLLAVNFAYTVSAGSSSGALTIALHRDGEADEEVLRQSGEQDWTEMQLPTATLDRLPVEGLSICYEKGSGIEAGQDLAGVDNIRLETASPLVDFCDLVMADGSGGSSCAALAEAAESSARVSYVPAKSPWRLGEGPTADFGLALFSAAVGSGERSCLRLRLNEGRQLLAANFWYTVDAGTSTGALTISLERDEEEAEEILRESVEAVWATLRHTVDLRRPPVVGISICYEKGSGIEAGLDRAGVDNIRLETASPVADFCDLVMADGSGGSSCAALAEDEDSGARVSYEPAENPWRLGEGPPEDNFGPALFSAAVGSGESSCLRLQLEEGRQLLAADFWYTVDAGASGGALTIVLERDEELDGEEILRASSTVAWATASYTADLALVPIVGISICYAKGSDSGDAGLDWAGVDNIRLETASPLMDFCDLVLADGSGGSSCAALAEAEGNGARVSYPPPSSLWRLGEGQAGASDLALFSSVVGVGESSCLRLQLREGRQLLALNLDYTVSAGDSTGALTIALHRDGAADEEVLRRSGELGWTEMMLPAATPGRLPVEGVSICYEKGSGIDAGEDWAGVDNIRLDTADPLMEFCDLAVVGGRDGRGCGVLAEVGEGNDKVEYRPAASPWLVSNRPMGEGMALLSVPIDSDESSCLRLSLELLPSQRFGALNMDYTVSTGTLTILLERGEEAPEEILRASGEQPWTGLQHSVDPERGQVSIILMCYEKSTAIEDTGLAWAGVDNIELLAADPVADFCDLVIEGGSSGASCAALDVVDGFRVAYTPQQSPWILGSDASGSGLALFSADVGSGEDSCLQFRFPELHVVTELSLDYRALLEDSGGMLTIQLQRDVEENELILRRSSPESEWTEFQHVVDLERARVSGLLACYQQGKGTMEGSASDRVGLDDLSFVYEYLYDRSEFCRLGVKGSSSGENCKWVRAAQSSPADRLWGEGASFSREFFPSWIAPQLNVGGSPREKTCLRLRLQPHRGSLVLTGLSFTFRTRGFEDSYIYRIRRVGQQNSEILRSVAHERFRFPMVETYDTSDDLVSGHVAKGLISDFSLCYTAGSLSPGSVQVPRFELTRLEFQSETVAVSRLRSTLLPRLFHIARRPQSVDFAVQALSQLGTVIDSAVQTTLTVRSGAAGMRLSLTVPETGQSASGESEVSLPLSFSGEQNVVLRFNIPLAAADGTTLAVTVSGNAAVAGESRELQLFDFCGLTVHGGRDDEGDEDLRQSCGDFARAVSAVYFDPPDKPWRVAAPSSFAIDNSVSQLAPNGQTSAPTKPWRAPGQPDLRLYSLPLERFEKSCMHLQLSPLATVTGLSLHWFLTSLPDDDFTISLDGADTNGEEEILRESGWVESWAPFNHTVSNGPPSRMSFCYERTSQIPNTQSGAGVDNLRLEYTPLPPAEFTGDATVTKDDLLLALRAVGVCSDPAAREGCIATEQLSTLVANLGVDVSGARMASITEALLALDSTATRSAYDFDRSGVVDEMDFRVLLRYLAGLRGAALVETEGGDPPDEFILRAILDR